MLPSATYHLDLELEVDAQEQLIVIDVIKVFKRYSGLVPTVNFGYPADALTRAREAAATLFSRSRTHL